MGKQHWIQQTSNLLNGSDTSMTHSWVDHMGQQILHRPNSLRITMKFRMEVEFKNTLPLLGVIVMKMGPDFVMKV
jgi:hypothetical protein